MNKIWQSMHFCPGLKFHLFTGKASMAWTVTENTTSASSRMKSQAGNQGNPDRLEKWADGNLVKFHRGSAKERNNLPAPGLAGDQLAAVHRRTRRSWWTVNGTRGSGVPLLWHTLSCSNKSLASRLMGMIISMSSVLVQLLLESNFEPASTRKTLNKCCVCQQDSQRAGAHDRQGETGSTGFVQPGAQAKTCLV